MRLPISRHRAIEYCFPEKRPGEMAEPLPHIEDPQVLDEKLREILVAGSLYRNFVYTGKGCHYTALRGMHRYGLLPKQLRMYCDHERCKAETWWDVDRQDHYFSSGFIQERHYTCRNCGKNMQYY